MRLNLPAAAGLLPIAMLGACATHHLVPPPPGLAYACRTAAGAPAGDAIILFNGQGYQPGNVVRAPDAGAGARELPRSTARLWFGGHDYEMMADWSEFGLRYRTIGPVVDNRALLWAADGEDARILSVPPNEAGPETELASCTRKRSLDGAHPPGHGEPAHAGSGDPHRR